MEFLNETHKKRFYLVMNKAGIDYRDCEREALFYILTGNDNLYRHLDQIYDFKNRRINPNEIEKLGYLSSSLLRLMHLGLHLYNDSNELHGTLVDTICGLDANNRELAFNAMRIRTC